MIIPSFASDDKFQHRKTRLDAPVMNEKFDVAGERLAQLIPSMPARNLSSFEESFLFCSFNQFAAVCVAFSEARRPRFDFMRIPFQCFTVYHHRKKKTNRQRFTGLLAFATLNCN
jgi:hypothetical protein